MEVHSFPLQVFPDLEVETEDVGVRIPLEKSEHHGTMEDICEVLVVSCRFEHVNNVNTVLARFIPQRAGPKIGLNRR